MRSVRVNLAAWRGPELIVFVLAVAAVSGTAVQVSPSSFDVFSENPGMFERTISLSNPSADPVTLELRVNFNKVPAQARRRLDDPVLANPPPQTSLVDPHAGRRRARTTPEQHGGRQLGHDKPSHTRCSDRSRLLLRFRTDAASSGSASEEHGAKLRRLQQDPDLAISGWQHLAHVNLDLADLDCSAGLEPEEILNRLQKKYGSQLELAEIDSWVWPTQAPNDPSWSQLWGMTRSKVAEAWARLDSLNIDGQTQPEVVVAVIDTGVKLAHPDLAGMLWTNPGEVPGNGIDDDGNGYVDDVHGYDFHLNQPNGNDVQGHGTHCAGVIAAEADNGIGVAGIASKHARVRIMALGFLGVDGGSISNALRALEYAVAMGVPISSNSWGGGGASEAFQLALRAATNHLFIVAAGNSGSDNDVSPMYPCSYPEANVICVAATTSSDTLASYSSYGATKVHIAAPGSSIYSTYTATDYTHLSGTSMATPHVSGAAALVASAFPHLSTQDIKQLILASSEVVPWLSGRVQTGLLDVLSLVSLAEASSWLWLSPTGTAQKVMSYSATVGGGSSIDIGLHIGLPHITAGFYNAAVEVSWPNGQIQVPVSYIVQGSPDLQLTSASTSLDWQVMSVGASVEKLLGFVNNGSGTARIQVDTLSPPFESSGEVLEVLPSETAWVKFTCAPSDTGNWSALATIRTNSGLDPRGATLPGGINQGTQYVISLECESKEPPYLSLDRHSGASLVPASGHPQHFDPSVPAEWEAALPEGDNSIEATLVIADAGNPEGCNAHTAAVQGHIVLVSRGTCYFQLKAQHAQDAGAVGVIIYDNLDVTTIAIMAMPSDAANPLIPGYLISKALGLSLKSRVEATEPLRVAIKWKPVHLWTNHPLANGGPASAAIVMSNLGHMPLSWSVRVYLGFNKDQNLFYDVSYTGITSSSGTPPSFEWATLDATSELTFFSGRYLDDDALALSMPFSFPFFGELFDSIWISSNGLLILDTSFVPGTDHNPSLPSRLSPNGLIAGFWRDLVCGSTAKVSVKHLNDAIGDFLVVQFEHLSYFDLAALGHAGSDLVSFEVRLYSSGLIVYNFKEFPTTTTLLASVRIGVETIDGAHGVDIRNSLYTALSAGQPFAASFTPWLAPVGNPSSIVPPGESLPYTFAVQGLTDQKGFISVVASDSTGSWKTERRVRLMQEAFKFRWHAESWAPCTRNTCGVAGPSTKTRGILCHGSDGAAYETSHCSNSPSCNDVLAWKDRHGDSCATHVLYAWCTSTGGYGPNWLSWWGTFDSAAAGGHTAPTACCGCGGGVATVEPVASESCSGGIDLDSDADGSPDCVDGCPDDPLKATPGTCGCGKTELSCRSTTTTTTTTIATTTTTNTTIGKTTTALIPSITTITTTTTTNAATTLIAASLATAVVLTTTLLAPTPASLATTLTTSALAVAMGLTSSTTTVARNPVKTTTTVQSSVVLQGLEETAGMEDAIIAALAGALGVDISQVRLLNTEQLSGEGVRRLTIGLKVDFEVVFETVVFETVDESANHATADAGSSPGGHTGSSSGSAAPASASSSGSAGGASSPALPAAGTWAHIANSLKQMSEDPEIFVTHLTTAFEEQGTIAPPTLQVQVRQPTVQRVLVQRISGPWSACQDESRQQYLLSDPCSDRAGQQTTTISCINASDLSDRQPEALCQGLPALPNERQCIIAGQTDGECTTTITTTTEVLENDMQKAELKLRGDDAVESSMESESLHTPLLVLCASFTGFFTLLAIVCTYHRHRRRCPIYAEPSPPNELAEGPEQSQ